MDATAAIIVALITVLLSGGGAFLWRAQNQKTKADAAAVLTDKALALTNTYSGRIKALEQRVCGLEKTVKWLEQENAALRAGIALLHEQVVGLGGDPVWALSDLNPKPESGRLDTRR